MENLCKIGPIPPNRTRREVNCSTIIGIIVLGNGVYSPPASFLRPCFCYPGRKK